MPLSDITGLLTENKKITKQREINSFVMIFLYTLSRYCDGDKNLLTQQTTVCLNELPLPLRDFLVSFMATSAVSFLQNCTVCSQHKTSSHTNTHTRTSLVAARSLTQPFSKSKRHLYVIQLANTRAQEEGRSHLLLPRFPLSV